VVGVCSGGNAQLAKDNGATKVIDYAKESFVDVCGEGHFDVVFDSASASGGGENYHEECEKARSKEGHYVYLNGGLGKWLRAFSPFKAARSHLFLTNHSRTDLEFLTKDLGADGSRIKPKLDCTLPFTTEGVTQGFERLRSRRAKGKVVFTISTDEHN
jgi:NADPH:quinone reductase-like Zn-dependent oxidoreductase